MLTYSGAPYDERKKDHTDVCVCTPMRLHRPALISKSTQPKLMKIGAICPHMPWGRLKHVDILRGSLRRAQKGPYCCLCVLFFFFFCCCRQKAVCCFFC